MPDADELDTNAACAVESSGESWIKASIDLHGIDIATLHEEEHYPSMASFNLRS
jgi:hypothetical protein